MDLRLDECVAAEEWVAILFVLVAITFGVAAVAFTFVRSKLAPMTAAIALLLGLVIEGQGIRSTMRALAEVEDATRTWRMGPDQVASSRRFAMYCAYKGAGLGAVPLAGGLIGLVVMLQRRADRKLEIPQQDEPLG